MAGSDYEYERKVVNIRVLIAEQGVFPQQKVVTPRESEMYSVSTMVLFVRSTAKVSWHRRFAWQTTAAVYWLGLRTTDTLFVVMRSLGGGD